VVNVLGERRLGDPDGVAVANGGGDDEPRILREMRGCLDSLRAGDDPVGVYHDASHARSEAEDLFALGHLSLEHRALCDELFWATCRMLAASSEVVARVPELRELLAEQYYCNFSLFQSLPDSWAIDQRFPIAPIHRLDERPDRSAILGDITCDSDGRVEQFIADGNPARTLPVHGLSTGPLGVEPYYLGVFLVGAYQETLGDLHNLLGDTHAVHVATDPDGSWEIQEVVDGDTTEEVLRYVQYDPEQIRSLIRRES
jgi:arginine decarboxylase